MMDQQQFAAAPRFLSESLLFPYMQGILFITEGTVEWGRRDWDPGELPWEKWMVEVRNRLFENYPTSTEQILHAEKYFSRRKDSPTEFSLETLEKEDLIPPDNRLSNVAGEFGIQCILAEQLPPLEAQKAAAGWDGDRIIFGGQFDGTYGVGWLSAWDTDDDADDFARALTAYFQKQRPDLAEKDGAPPGRVRLLDGRGAVVIESREGWVACAHADELDRADRIVEALLAVAKETEIVP
jgi:hypothetical protein